MVSGGSAITGTWAEVLYANSADGTAASNFTLETQLNPNPVPVFPGYFFNVQYGVQKAIKIIARGVVSTTTSGPNWTFFVRINSTSGPILGQTQAIASSASLANSVWVLELDSICRVVGSGGTGNLSSSGTVQCGGFTTPFQTIPNNSATWTVAMDTTVTNGIFIDATCSAGNAANSIQLKELLILGLN